MATEPPDWSLYDGIVIETMHLGREQVLRALRRHGCPQSVDSINRRIRHHKERQKAFSAMAPQMADLLKRIHADGLTQQTMADVAELVEKLGCGATQSG